MIYFNTCPTCGAHLDPCEVCDCQQEDSARSLPVEQMNRPTIHGEVEPV